MNTSARGRKTRDGVDAYVLGKRAWQNDQVTEGNNPFEARTADAAQWLKGYREARRASLPKDEWGYD